MAPAAHGPPRTDRGYRRLAWLPGQCRQRRNAVRAKVFEHSARVYEFGRLRGLASRHGSFAARLALPGIYSPSMLFAATAAPPPFHIRRQRKGRGLHTTVFALASVNAADSRLSCLLVELHEGAELGCICTGGYTGCRACAAI